MVWTAFCGSRNKKEKTESDIPQPSGIKKKGGGKSLAFFFKEAVCSFHEPCSFSLKLMACSAEQTEGTSTHLGCDICPESNDLDIFEDYWLVIL